MFALHNKIKGGCTANELHLFLDNNPTQDINEMDKRGVSNYFNYQYFL